MRRNLFSCTAVFITLLILSKYFVVHAENYPNYYGERTPYPTKTSVTENNSEERKAIEAERKLNAEATITSKREEAQQKKDATVTKMSERKDEAFSKMQEKFLASIDRLIYYLENNLKKEIQQHNNLGDYIATLLPKVDILIADLQEYKTQVQAASSLEEIRGLGEKLKSAWSEVQAIRKGGIGIAIAERFDLHISKAQELAQKVSNKLTELKSQGVDTSSADEKIAEYNRAIADAQAKFVEAHSIFTSINGDNRTDGLFNQGLEKIRQAKNSLYLAGQALREALIEIKNVTKTDK
jgi:hypothetical protein